MNSTKTISTPLPITLRAWLAVALLVIVSSFEVIKVIHVDHHHTAETTTCTERDEADACHRSIVHFDADAGCSHTHHVEKLVADCEICDALTTTFLFEVSEEFPVPFEHGGIEQHPVVVEKPYTVSFAYPSLRGPPSLS